MKNKCEFCNNEFYKEFKGFKLCFICYQANIRDKVSTTGKVVKRDEVITKAWKDRL